MAKKKRRKGANKGSNFERAICKDLSLWISSDKKEPSDDHFWRTAGSGGRATVRARRGKKTKENEGDIKGTSSLGRRFIKRIAMEIKCGYSSYPNATITDQLDSPANRIGRTLLDWINQAVRTQKMSEAEHWMLIHKRDRRQAIVYCNVSLYRRIESVFISYFMKKKMIGGVVRLTNKKEVGIFPLRKLFQLEAKQFREHIL